MVLCCGRATLGNPWIIKQIADELENKITNKEISLNEKLSIILEHLDLAIQEKGEYIAIREMRKHLCWYLKNLKDSSKVREEINRLENRDLVESKLKEYFNSL